MNAYTLKIRGGVSVDSMGKKAGKGALVQTELSATLGVAQDQYLFQPIGLHGDISPTLDASYYKGCEMRQGVERELVFEPICYSFDSVASNSMKSSNPHSGCREVEISKTVDTTNQDPSKNQGGIAIVQTYDARGNGDGVIVSTITGDHNGHISDYTSIVVEPLPLNQVIPLEGNGSRPSHRGKGWNESDKMFSLNTTEVHAVAYATGNGQSQNMRLSTQVGTLDCMHDQKIVLQPCYWDGSQTAGTLTANNAGGNQRMPDKENFNCILDVFSRQRTDEYKENDTASTLSARDYKSATDLIVIRGKENVND